MKSWEKHQQKVGALTLPQQSCTKLFSERITQVKQVSLGSLSKEWVRQLPPGIPALETLSQEDTDFLAWVHQGSCMWWQTTKSPTLWWPWGQHCLR